MKQNIRRGVFETNSSSTHSISIASTEGLLDVLTPDEHGNIYINGDGEYGWEVESYNNVGSKADYALIDQQSNPDRLEMLKRVIEQQTGGTVILNYEPSGYIDHQSHGTTNEAFESEETLKTFLFSKNSWICTSNDNGGPDWKFENGNATTVL